jgi:glycosyltransferase 2 family protein
VEILFRKFQTGLYAFFIGMLNPKPWHQRSTPNLITAFQSLRIRVLATLALTAVLCTQLELDKIIRILSGFDQSIGLFMVAVNILLLHAFARRWQIIAAGLDFHPPYSQMIRAIWLASFLGQFGPTLLVAEATRFQVLRRYATKTQLCTSQILDRISGQLVLFAAVAMLFPFYIVQLDATLLKLLSGLIVMLLLAAAVIRFLYQRTKTLPRFEASNAIALLDGKNLRGHYGVSVIIQLLLVLNFCLAAAGLGVGDHLLPLLFMTPLVFAATTLMPITISDWGSRETAAVLLLSPTGLEPETIISISVLYGLFYLLAALPGGWFLLAARRQEWSRNQTSS